MKSFVHVFLVLSLVALSGCGDLMGGKVVKKELESSRFRANCELDVNAFTQILHKNISNQIKCLEENLNIFIKVVKTTRRGHLSKEALELFIVNNRPDITPEMLKAIKAIFDVNYLVTGEDPDFISHGNVKRLINFAIIFNAEAALNFGPVFENESEVTYDLHQNHRERVSKSTKAIIIALLKIFKDDKKDEVRKLNTYDLLESFTTEDTRDEIEKVKKMLFAKTVILGGRKDEITQSELEDLILNFKDLLLIALDGVRYKYILLNHESMMHLLKPDVVSLNDMIYRSTMGNRNHEILFKIDEAIEVAKLFIKPEDFDVEKFKNLIVEAKKIAMGGNGVEVKGLELKNLFNHALSLLQTGTIFHSIYEKFKIDMDSTLPVTINFDEYRHTYPGHQKELKQFERIVKKYRFFKGEFISPYYTTGQKRNAKAIFEVALFEYLIKMVFARYGSSSPNRDSVGGYSIDQFQMQALFKKFQNDLVELDLISPLWPTVTADNVSLLGTLFQYQSDKNKVMDVNEASEFGVSLFTSLGITKDIVKHFKDKRCQFDEFGRVEPTCVRQNFFKGFCKGYRSYYPLLFSSIGTPKKCEDLPLNEFNINFLERAIGASRPCMHYTDGAKEEIWYTESDLNTMLMVILHAETTVLRWDTNKNNLLDTDEVNKAYDIYSPALDGFLETRPAIIKKFKRQIYQYLIKYEEVPDEKSFKSVWKFIKFLMSFRKASTATRKTITSVLKSIGDENAKLPGAPKIDCNLLRDPDNLPRHPKYVPREKDNRPDYSHLLEGYVNFIQ